MENPKPCTSPAAWLWTEKPHWSSAAELKAWGGEGGRCRGWDPLSPSQLAAISTQKRCRAAEQDKRVWGRQRRETEGWSETEWERRRTDKEEGRETHTHTKIRARGRQRDNEGGRDPVGRGGPHLDTPLHHSPSLLHLSPIPLPALCKNPAMLGAEHQV